MPAVSLKGIGKKYRVYPSRQEQLKEVLSFGRRRRGHDFWALADVDLEVEPGTTLGILGRNGAGKSTLLRILSGVVQPTTGTVEVNGRMAALFGVGAGFNPEFTGRDNVMLNGLLLGIERKEMMDRFDEIEAFADIGEFMDQPVKTYSSGMRARLGFAVAVNVDPDILIVDETLSVGDALFKQTGLQKMRDLRDSGTTVLFVSHSMGMVKNFCNKAALLHKGKLIASGDTAEVADRYGEIISSAKAQGSGARRVVPDDELEYELEHEEEEDAVAPAFKEGSAARGVHRGTGEARIQHVELLDGSRTPIESTPSGSTIIVRAHLRYEEAVNASVLGITLRDKTGLEVFSTDTTVEERPLRKRTAGERVIADFVLQVPLRPGNYSVKATLSTARNQEACLDRVDVAAVLRITRAENGRRVPGLVRLPTTVELHDPEKEAEPPEPLV